MKSLSKILTAGVFTAVALGATVFGFNGAAAANASCRWQYDPSGNFQTSQTPVFNSICGVPTNGIGNEPDFVRIRQSVNGNNEDNSANPSFTDSLTAACNAGDKFDIHTYIHNDAMSQFNDNGSGTAVAHNVALAQTAALNTTNNHFTFGSTISASNAASVSDTANLGCGDNVKLTLVPSTVHVYSQSYGWQSLADSAVNGSTPLGSPTMGSGNQWGCWEFRIVVVYTVTVQKETPPTPVYTCDMLDITASENRTVKVSVFNTTAKNGATFKNADIDWGDTTTETGIAQLVGRTHTYSKEGTYTIKATAHFTVNGEDKTATSASCEKIVTFQPNVPPTVTPPPTTVTTVSPPTTLVNTGAGSVAGLFAAATVAGAVAYRRVIARRLSRQ